MLEALKNLPETLDDTYARILTNTSEGDQRDARRALWWLASSNRLLRIEEVAEAAVVDPELSPPFDPESRLLDPSHDILEILGSLVTVPLEGTSIGSCDDYLSLSGTEIRLAHFSFKIIWFPTEFAVARRTCSAPTRLLPTSSSQKFAFYTSFITVNQVQGLHRPKI